MAMTSIIINLGIGLTYFLLTRIALMLTLTPGAMALIYPAAGLALAACLIWQGKRIWPSLVISAILSNCISSEGQFETDWLPWLISFGSLAQALVAEKLLRYYEPALEFSRPMSVFGLWVITLGCCFIGAINGSIAFG